MMLQKHVKKVDQVRDPYGNPKEISIDKIYMYHLLISYLFSIVSIEVMRYNKQFMIIIRSFRTWLCTETFSETIK